MHEDLEPLAEKLVAKEKLTLEDFQAVIDAYKAAAEDGRISFLEVLRIGAAVLKILQEFVNLKATSPGGGFGFEKQ